VWEEDKTRNSSPAGRWDGGGWEMELGGCILGMLWEGGASLARGNLAPKEELRIQIHR